MITREQRKEIERKLTVDEFLLLPKNPSIKEYQFNRIDWTYWDNHKQELYEFQASHPHERVPWALWITFKDFGKQMTELWIDMFGKLALSKYKHTEKRSTYEQLLQLVQIYPSLRNYVFYESLYDSWKSKLHKLKMCTYSDDSDSLYEDIKNILYQPYSSYIKQI